MSSAGINNTTASAPLAPRQLDNLLSILRRANARYQKIADELRRTLKLKNNARNRACDLGLKVDIVKAVNCPQRAVAVLPLPILDISASPTISTLQPQRQVAAQSQRQRAVTPARRKPAPTTIVIPAVGSARRPAKTAMPTSPISPLCLDIRPAFSTPKDAPQEALRSRWSMTPGDALPIIMLPSVGTISMPPKPVIPTKDLPIECDDEEISDMDCSRSPSPLFAPREAGSGSSATPNTSPIMIRIKRKMECDSDVEMSQTPPKFRKDARDESPARRSTRASARK